MKLEENILRIKEVMGLITEAGETPQGVEINLGNVFDSGKYVVTPTVGSKVNGAITQIKNFISKNPNKPILVTIESSESKVPNYDREKFPVTGNKTTDFTEDKRLPVGELSKKRANNLATYLKPKLPKNATINIVDKGSQGPPWKTPFNAQDPNYIKNQYVKLYAKLNATKPISNSTSTVKTQIDPKVCNQEFESSGGVGDKMKGFISDEKIIQLGGGNETFKFLLDSQNVPDIMILECNGETQSTGFIGANLEIYQILLGTIIYMRYDAYSSPRPWWFKDYKLLPTPAVYADKVLKTSMGDWQPSDLKHIFGHMGPPELGINYFQKMEQVPDAGFYTHRLEPNAIKSFGEGVDAWNSASSLTLRKTPEVTTAKVTIIGPIGQTQWKLYVKCGDIPPWLTTKGVSYGDIKY